MSKNEARRQKQLAKKKAKRDEKRTQLIRRNSDNPLIRLSEAAQWPVVDALVPDTLLTQGIGQLLLARRMPDGRLAMANYLVDVYCLGVKNAYWDILSQWDYDKMKRKVAEIGALHPVTPMYFAKLVHGAVAYAEAIGIPPHPDYRHARMLLAGIDPTLCTAMIIYGKGGKPLYINGPHESPERIRMITQKVEFAGGEVMLMLGGSGFADESDLEFDDEQEPLAIE